MYAALPSAHFETGAVPAALAVKGWPCRRASARSLPAGARLFCEGDEARSVYRVTRGVLRLTRISESGCRQVMSFGYTGDIVGFSSGGHHLTNCEAVTAAEVSVFCTSIFTARSFESELQLSLLKAALAEIKNMQDHFLTLNRKSATERLASFLLALAGRAGTQAGGHTQVHMPMPRADIADFLGLAPETVSRVFTALRRQRVIAIDQIYTVILLDRNRLLALAGGGHRRLCAAAAS